MSCAGTVCRQPVKTPLRVPSVDHGTDSKACLCANTAMRQASDVPLPDCGTAQDTGPGVAGGVPPMVPKDNFPERHDDPEQAEELERQQDA